jgi:hypothetical protein
MASYTIGPGQIGLYATQLTANTVDTVTISNGAGSSHSFDPLEVWADGTAAVYFTVDGSTPTVASQSTYEIPSGASAVRDHIVASAPTTVKLISSGTPKYSITAPGSH